MELVYASAAVETLCTSAKAAYKLFGGDKALADSLLARINALESADTIKDIMAHPTFHFRKLQNKSGNELEGFFSIVVKSGHPQWHIVLQPLDKNKKPYVPCNIEEISGFVKIVEITEVSRRYE